MKTYIPLILLLFLCACRGPKGDPGSDGVGKDGPPGLPGLPGPSGTIPFTYQGIIELPAQSVIQTIPNFDVEKGDIVSVYLRWHSGPLVWSQIGATWVGGMAGYYSVVDNVVTVTVVTNVDTEWLINGLKRD